MLKMTHESRYSVEVGSSTMKRKSRQLFVWRHTANVDDEKWTERQLRRKLANIWINTVSADASHRMFYDICRYIHIGLVYVQHILMKSFYEFKSSAKETVQLVRL